jgi:CO/xanthine dehydrogenase FAD-binding subunit
VVKPRASSETTPRAFRPRSLKEALNVRRDRRALPFAGGTDLMAARRRGPGLRPDLPQPLLFLGHLQELAEIRPGGGTLNLGAACTLSALLLHDAVPAPLKAALAEMASPALRNVATLGGNICNASPAGDTLPFLYAVEAELELAGAAHSRRLPIGEFILGPGRTALADDELLTNILLPDCAFDTWFYRKAGTRRANALSKLSFLGLARRGREGRVEDFRCAFGAVAATVVRAPGLEARLKKKTPGQAAALLPALRGGYAALLRPIDDQRSTARYRADVAVDLLAQFITTLTTAKESP